MVPPRVWIDLHPRRRTRCIHRYCLSNAEDVRSRSHDAYLGYHHASPPRFPRLGYNSCRIINACQTAKYTLSSEDPTSDLVNMIEELHTIAIETSAWTDLLPESWLPWTSPCAPHDTEPAMLDDINLTNNVQYSDIWIANTWNRHRTYQVHLHETLYECYSALPSTTPSSSAQDEIQGAVGRLTDDMLDSVPFLLGVNGEMQYHPELGSYYAFGVIDCVGKSLLAGEEQKEMARRLGGRIVEG